uniref:Uncharacterized protein n=1 Tax=Romanomermis culicivorax TaxID=13658 RepID=A0A915JU59_ROMCU
MGAKVRRAPHFDAYNIRCQSETGAKVRWALKAALPNKLKDCLSAILGLPDRNLFRKEWKMFRILREVPKQKRNEVYTRQTLIHDIQNLREDKSKKDDAFQNNSLKKCFSHCQNFPKSSTKDNNMTSLSHLSSTNVTSLPVTYDNVMVLFPKTKVIKLLSSIIGIMLLLVVMLIGCYLTERCKKHRYH